MSARRPTSTALITGGAGFVGTNLASRLVEDGRRVVVLDDLSRPGVTQNLRWLRKTYGSRVRFERGDVRDRQALRRALAGVSEVYHLAAQVAVTTSLDAPVDDFRVNAEGTLMLLEELRRLDEAPFLLFTSTNKVYGSLPRLELVRKGGRWEPADPRIRRAGLSEDLPLDFCTPYGCSKGAADQYVLDYAKSYGVPSVVFRMSCIYGPHQHGTEDQGWVAHFAIRALEGEPITLYGDGAQVRDILYVEDLVEAMLHAREQVGRVAGHAFNMGGGPANAVSLLEVVELLGALGSSVDVCFADERPGDQRYYVANTARFARSTGWRPSVDAHDGIERLHHWLARNRSSSRTELRAVAL
jgi:CDP-paratose 2-epimerase